MRTRVAELILAEMWQQRTDRGASKGPKSFSPATRLQVISPTGAARARDTGNAGREAPSPTAPMPLELMVRFRPA